METHDDSDYASGTSDIERTRSTPLLSVVWMTGVLVWATVVALFLNVPTWASVFLCTVTAISFFVFVVGYIYLFTNDREALRSERWRRVSGGTSLPDLAGQQRRGLGEDERRYLAPERAEFEVTHSDESVGNASRATNE
jgi:hypothetical protein